MFDRECPHCRARVSPYAASIALRESCPACGRFVRARVAAGEVLLWAFLAAVAAMPIAVVADHYAGRGQLAVLLVAALAALLALVRGRRLVADPFGDGTAVFLRASKVSQVPGSACYALHSSSGEIGEAELDLHSGRVRVRSFRDPAREARYAAYLERLFADFRPGQAPPEERTYAA